MIKIVNHTLVPAISINVDVPVDETHKDKLRESIKQNGQVADVLVRKLTYDVIDGFHRVAAMQDLGMDVRIAEVECSDEDFWSYRVISATQHEDVRVERAVTWIEKIWELSDLSDRYATLTAAISSVQTKKASPEVTKLIEDWCARWCVSPQTLRMWVGYGTTNPKNKKEEIVVPTTNSEAEVVETNNPTLPQPTMPVKVANVWAGLGILKADIESLRDLGVRSVPIDKVEELCDKIDTLIWLLSNLRSDLKEEFGLFD